MRVGGLASGMDTDSIVKELMAAQKMPLDKLTQQKTFTEWQKEALRDTNLEFRNLRDSASNLRLQSSFNSYSATSANSSSVTVDTTANAMSGSYTVKVTNVASAAKMNSAAAIKNAANEPAQSTDAIGVAGKMKIVSGDTEVEITIDAEMTFADLAKEIQGATANEDLKLRASFDNTTSRFFMTTKGMGGDQNFTMNFTDADGADSPALAAKVINDGTNYSFSTAAESDFMTSANYGSVEFDGIEINDLKTNNTTVNGLTINLLAVGPETTVTIQSNPEKPMEMIKSFVESYNKTIEDLEKKLVEKRYPDFQPLSDEQKKDMTDNEIELWEEKARSGLLRNDPILRNAVQDLRRAFMDEVEDIPDGNIKLLSQIGINTGTYTEGGKLFIDEKVLSEKLTNNPDEVMQLFTYKDAAGNGVGIGDKVYTKLNEIVSSLSSQAGSPTSSVDNSNITKKIKQMDEEISRWQDRLTRIEDRYWRQFTAMEKALSQMNSQSAWMQQSMFGGM